MRALILISFAFLLCCHVTGQSHNLIIGVVSSYSDIVVYRSNEVKYGFPLIIRSTTIEYPEAGRPVNVFIRAIHVIDHYIDGNGGYPTISAGGIGQNFVKIKLKSQRGHGFNFTVTVFGRLYQ